jgi:hypothetical protein
MMNSRSHASATFSGAVHDLDAELLVHLLGELLDPRPAQLKILRPAGVCGDDAGALDVLVVVRLVERL